MDIGTGKQGQDRSGEWGLTAPKHTPGPWLIGRGADGFPIVHTARVKGVNSGQGIAHICKRPMSQEHEANAWLIAAAPDLLRAAKVLIATRPAFRLRPVGGEGSAARLEQRDAIEAEDALLAAIARAEAV